MPPARAASKLEIDEASRRLYSLWAVSYMLLLPVLGRTELLMPLLVGMGAESKQLIILAPI